MSLSYTNQSIDLLCKSVDWFLYEIVIDCLRIELVVYDKKNHSSVKYKTYSKYFDESSEKWIL